MTEYTETIDTRCTCPKGCEGPEGVRHGCEDCKINIFEDANIDAVRAERDELQDLYAEQQGRVIDLEGEVDELKAALRRMGRSVGELDKRNRELNAECDALIRKNGKLKEVIMEVSKRLNVARVSEEFE